MASSLIPDNLHMTSKARLLLVADILQNHPKRHDQSIWITGTPGGLGDLDDFLATPDPVGCNTKGCVAGWAVALTPREEVGADGWTDAMARSLELPYGVARRLVPALNKRKRLIKALRLLATVTPDNRTTVMLNAAGMTQGWFYGGKRHS